MRRNARATGEPKDHPSDWASLAGRMAEGQTETLAFSRKKPLPLHALVRSMSQYPWSLSIDCDLDDLRMRLTKRGGAFEISADTPHDSNVIAFHRPPSGLYLLCMENMAKVALSLEVTGGRLMEVTAPSGVVGFEAKSVGTSTLVKTSPIVLHEGGHPIECRLDSPQAKVRLLDVHAEGVSAPDAALALPPDQFRRFRAAAIAAELIAGREASFLDAGSGLGGLSRFLPRLETLDTEFLDRAGHHTGSLIETALPSCDVGFLIDTLEHISKQDRTKALANLASACRVGLVILAPFDEPGRREADGILQSFFIGITGAEHAPLAEHLSNGLPSLEETRRTLEGTGLSCSVVKLQPLDLWVVTSAIGMQLERDPQLASLRDLFYRFVNERFPSGTVTDAEPSYETMIIATRKPLPRSTLDEIRQRLDRTTSTVSRLPGQTLPLILESFAQRRILEKDAEIGRLRGEVARVEVALEQVTRRHEELGADRDNWRALYREAESDRVAKIEHIGNITSDLRASVQRTRELTADQESRIREAESLRQTIAELQDSIMAHVAAREEASTLRQTIVELQRLIEAHVAAREEIVREAASLRIELDRNAVEAASLRVDQANRMAIIDGLQSQIESVSKDRDNWRDIYLTAESDRIEKAKHIVAIELEVERVRAELTATRDAALAEREGLQVQIESIEETRALQSAELAERLGQIQRAQMEADDLRSRIGAERRDAENRNAELLRKEAHIARMESQLRDVWSSKTWRLLRFIDRLTRRVPRENSGGRQASGTGAATADLNGEPAGEDHRRSRLRILQCAHFFLPRHYAGSELYTYYLCKELQKRHSVRLFFAEHDLTRPQYSVVDGEYDGIAYRQITNNFHYDSFEQTYQDQRTDTVFERLLDEFTPDVVHFQHLLNLSIGCVRAAHARRIPVVCTLHDYWLTCPSGGQRFRDGSTICDELDFDACSACFMKSPFNASAIEKRIFDVARRFGSNAATGVYVGLNAARVHAPSLTKIAVSANTVANRPSLAPEIRLRLERIRAVAADVDLFVTPSRFARDVFVKFGIPEERVRCVPNGHAPFSGRPRAESRLFRAGFVGTIAQHKGVHLLIEACRLLPPGSIEIRIFGETTVFPEYVRELRKLAEGLPVRFHGKIDNARIADAYAEMDVLVVPSLWWENSPLTVHEAFMAGLPVIAAAIGGLPELVKSGVNGLLFAPGDASDLAGKLKAIMDDPTMLQKFRANAPPVKTIAANALEIEEIYESLLVRNR